MTAFFADTSFYIALLVRRDAAHSQAHRWAQEIDRGLVTTAWIVNELAAFFSAPPHRQRFVQFWDDQQSHPQLTILPPDLESFDMGFDLYRRRTDKDWSLVDRISFTAMNRLGLTEALTTDHHFEQAGFRALLASGV